MKTIRIVSGTDLLFFPGVSRETQQRIEIIVAQIRKWQPSINLVSSSTLEAIWTRHIQDSLQLIPLVPTLGRWIDLGSGGGFPGLVVAAVQAETSGARMVLVESSGKKCAFLRETARLAELPVDIIHARIDDAVPELRDRFDVVSARALAPLKLLLAMAEPFLQKGTIGIFPKGQDVDEEIKDASISWKMEYNLIDSQTESGAKIVIIRSARRR